MFGVVIMIIIFVAVGMASFCMLWSYGAEPSGEGEHMMDWHRRHGTCRVRYPDGKTSQPMSRKCARDYQEWFGGSIIPR
jgi:hypothetical protein